MQIPPTRIAIVDDHPGAAGLMAHYLSAGFDVVGQASRGTDAIELVRRERPDVTLLDVDLREESGFALVKPLARLKTIVLLFTRHDFEALRSLAVKAGAMGLISMGGPVGTFAEAIHTVATGGRWFPEPGSPSPGMRTLGAQRLAIVRLLRDGFSTKQIAAQLGRSIGSIEFHIRVLKSSLVATTHAGIVGECIRRGYIPPPGLEDESVIMTPRPA